MTATTSTSFLQVSSVNIQHADRDVMSVSNEEEVAINPIKDIDKAVSSQEVMNNLSIEGESEPSLGWGLDDPLFVLPKCNMPPISEMEPVESFVEAAIRDQHELDEIAAPIKTYKGLLDVLKWKHDLDMLHKVLLGLRSAGRGSTLNLLTSSRKHARLVHQILRLNPFDLPPPQSTAKSASTDLATNGAVADYDIADAQLNLLLAVVSANTVFLVPTLTFAWKLLANQSETGSIERSRRCHAFLASILRLVPKAKTELFPVLSSNAPFRTKPEEELVWYYEQCLYVLRYHPGLQSQVIDMLVDKCLEMDVEIKISDVGDAVIDDENDDDACFEIDLTTNEPKERLVTADVTVDEMANKLDALMLLLFRYLESSNDQQSGIESMGVLYDIFARVFESSILICYKSKFVQFLLFYLCGLEGTMSRLMNGVSADHSPVANFHRDFCTSLIGILLDPYRATATRQSGACYLASFVSRASFVNAETVCEAVSALLRWAEAYLNCLDAPTSSVTSTLEDSREQCNLHSLFYTVCQSTFYIMCFRGAEALAFYKNAVESQSTDVLQYIDISSDRWSRICSHATQPLRFCLESVRVEFLALARTHSLLDAAAGDILERGTSSTPLSVGKRRRPISAIKTPATLEKERLSGGVGGLGQGKNPLDSFFPFDPYLLRRSHAFIEPFYIHWSGVTGEAGNRGSHDTDNPDVGQAAEESDASSSEEDDESDSGVEDEISDSSDDDDEEEDQIEGGNEEADDDADQANVQLMSFVSNSSGPLMSKIPTGSPESIAVKRDELRAVWTDTLKRSRAPSIENGSW